jgi:hypothetical protein
MPRRRSIRLAGALGACLAAVLAAAPAVAQETTSQLTGFVIGGDGQPIPGAMVTIVHLPTGTEVSTVTNASGQFWATGLRVGGPFRVSAQVEGMQETAVEELFTQLAERTAVTLVAQPIAQLAGVEVVGSSGRDVAIGAASRYGAQDVQELPSISRDIKDVVRVDPKAWVDPTNADALEVAGVNNRYNSITVDGVRQSDDFGLNANGYPTQHSPLSVDAIEAVSVLSAPFSVEYSFFHGSTINMVTKSGANAFAGSAYYYKGDDSLLGDRTKDTDVDLVFDEDTWGATFGGPIIRDRLFFFLAYEKLDRKAPQDIGAAGSGFPVEVASVSQADYDRIRRIGLDVYRYDIGETLASAPEQDEKFLAKLDWNVNEAHRASLSFQRTEGNELIVNSTNNNPATGRLGAPSNWYDRAIAMKTASLQVFSDWNEFFSTEVKLARKEVDTAQVSLFGTDFGEMIIDVPAAPGSGLPDGQVYIGSDEFRQANELSNDVDSIKLKGSFFLGDHTLTAGYERETLDIFNIFVPRSQGQWTFANIDDFEGRHARSLSYGNAFSNDANDAAADFAYDVDSFYVQDDWQATADFKIQAGLRLDVFSGDDEPALNANFTQRYGFDNQETLDGRELFMPRIGFNWQWTPNTTVYGGWGLFGGGTPNVWISNSFSNDGVTVVRTDVTRTGDPDDPLQSALDGVDGFDIPQEVLDATAAKRGDGPVNAIDPGFAVPSQFRWNLGLSHTLPFDVEMTADFLYSRVSDEVLWRDLRLDPAGTAPDGRPIYAQRADGRGPTTQDLLLTNTAEGESTVWSVDFSKTWRMASGRYDAYFGYGHQDVRDVNPGTSATASSNWDNVAASDPNDPGLATSNYQIEHRFTTTLAWRKAFFGDYETSVGLYGERRSGRPYSLTFGSGSPVWGDPRQAARQRQLFYVPDGDVIFEAPCSAEDVTLGVAGCASTSSYSSANAAAAQFASDMDAFIRQQGLEKFRGRIIPRNSQRSPWVTVLDLRVAQELPVFRKSRGIVTVDIENFANLLNNDWGQLRQVSFPYVAPVVDANRITAAGCPDGAPRCYVYRPRAGTIGPVKPFETISSLPSVWRIQLGLRIEF